MTNQGNPLKPWEKYMDNPSEKPKSSWDPDPPLPPFGSVTEPEEIQLLKDHAEKSIAEIQRRIRKQYLRSLYG